MTVPSAKILSLQFGDRKVWLGGSTYTAITCEDFSITNHGDQYLVCALKGKPTIDLIPRAWCSASFDRIPGLELGERETHVCPECHAAFDHKRALVGHRKQNLCRPGRLEKEAVTMARQAAYERLMKSGEFPL